MDITTQPYIPWNVEYLYSAVASFRSNIGAAINIGLWIFFIVAGVLCVISIIRYMAN